MNSHRRLSCNNPGKELFQEVGISRRSVHFILMEMFLQVESAGKIRPRSDGIAETSRPGHAVLCKALHEDHHHCR